MKNLFFLFINFINEKLEMEEFFKKFNESSSDFEYEKKVKSSLKLSFIEWKEK